MQTSGRGNDGLMVLVSVGVLLVVGVIVFGGFTNVLEAVNTLVREIVHQATELVSSIV
jgi:hypothetical protein